MARTRPTARMSTGGPGPRKDLSQLHRERHPPFIPENPSQCKTVQRLFMDEESADVIFEVGGRNLVDETGAKRSKTESTTFFAHHNILKTAAPLMAELCRSDASPSRIHLPDVSPQIFHHLLSYIYGCDVPDFESDLSLAKENRTI